MRRKEWHFLLNLSSLLIKFWLFIFPFLCYIPVFIHVIRSFLENLMYIRISRVKNMPPRHNSHIHHLYVNLGNIGLYFIKLYLSHFLFETNFASLEFYFQCVTQLRIEFIYHLHPMWRDERKILLFLFKMNE